MAMSAPERLNALVDIIGKAGFVNIRELAGQCNVSEITVRRDVKALAREGKVRLVHGGVAAAGGPGQKTGAEAQEYVVNRNKKKSIALDAAR